MKTCSRCKRSLPLDEYNRNATSADGLQCWCRTCCRDYKRGWNGNTDRLLSRKVDPAIGRLITKCGDVTDGCGREFPDYELDWSLWPPLCRDCRKAMDRATRERKRRAHCFTRDGRAVGGPGGW